MVENGATESGQICWSCLDAAKAATAARQKMIKQAERFAFLATKVVGTVNVASHAVEGVPAKLRSHAPFACTVMSRMEEGELGPTLPSGPG